MTLNAAVWKSCITVLQVVSIGSTFVRLGHRWCTKRMWWDDWIAIIPLLGNILDVVIMWMDLGGGGVASQSLNIVFSPWFGTLLFYIIVWVSRISLALSIARIFPPRHTCRRFAFCLTALFLIIFIANVLMSTFDCYKSSSAWYNMIFQNCLHKRGATVGVYATVVLDLLSDILLVVSPLTMLWRIKLPRQQRRLVLALFSSSILPLLASVIYCIIWGLSPRLEDPLLILRIMSQLQAGISLLVCNLLVVTMLFYRIVRREIVPDPAAERPPEPLPYLPPASTEKQFSESTRSTTTAAQTQTHVEENSGNTQSSTHLTQPSPPPSLVLTSLYDESIQQPSINDSSIHESTFSRYDEENHISGFRPSWSFSDKSISNSIHLGS